MRGKKTDQQQTASPAGATASQPPRGRMRQIAQAYRLTKRHDKHIGLLLLAIFVGVAGVLGFAGYVWLGPFVGVPLGITSGLIAVMIVFGRRVERAAYAQVEGQPGAAAAGLQMLRRGWDVKPAVAFTKNQDVVHRVVGRPGIILVGEGNPGRIRGLLSAERKKHARIGGEEIPVHEIVVGDGEGEVKLTKLNKHVQKMKKVIKPADQTALMNKLKALDAMRPAAPMPRGPMPTSMKGARKMMKG
jgi:hypothetical protein